MSHHTVDYFFAPQSPWTYLGHARFAQLVTSPKVEVRVKPVDLGKVFAVSGGLPLSQRPAQRRAYRLVELERFGRALGMPIHLHPKFFPVAGDPAARLIIAVDLAHGASAAMQLCGAIFAAVWAQERDIANPEVLAELLHAQQLPAACLEAAQSESVQARYDTYTQEAINVGVFGAPTYIVDGEMFWGQDRLDFVAQAVAR
jgi:2-hydroxychromene-2-carboxylate isomerase